jgi:hypothetical protein
VEAKKGIIQRFAACFTDHCNPERFEHTVPEPDGSADIRPGLGLRRYQRPRRASP